jgi:hypothetical protein
VAGPDGLGRAGWYAYDFIDNGGQRSAERILSEYQSIDVGRVLPALPGATDVFVVMQCEPEHSLVLSWRISSWNASSCSVSPDAQREAQRF